MGHQGVGGHGRTSGKQVSGSVTGRRAYGSKWVMEEWDSWRNGTHGCQGVSRSMGSLVESIK